MPKDILCLGLDMRLNLEIFGIKAPEFITAAPFVFGGLVVLDVLQEAIDILKFVFFKKARISKEFS